VNRDDAASRTALDKTLSVGAVNCDQGVAVVAIGPGAGGDNAAGGIAGDVNAVDVIEPAIGVNAVLLDPARALRVYEAQQPAPIVQFGNRREIFAEMSRAILLD